MLKLITEKLPVPDGIDMRMFILSPAKKGARAVTVKTAKSDKLAYLTRTPAPTGVPLTYPWRKISLLLFE